MRGQSMSFDAIAATFLFVLIAVFGAIYAFNFFSADIGANLNSEASALGELIIRDLSARPDGTDQTRIDERLLLAYIDRVSDDYDAYRGERGVNSDFCVFFEDENGDVVTLIVRNGEDIQVRQAHFGSSRVRLNATGGITRPCG